MTKPQIVFDEETERADFEGWVVGEYRLTHNGLLARKLSGAYEHASVNGAWQAWKGRARIDKSDIVRQKLAALDQEKIWIVPEIIAELDK